MSNNKMRIHTGDTVVVIAGKGRGTVGRVLRVAPDVRKVAVEGVRVVKRHQKASGDQPGSIVQKEALIDVSNVALWNAAESRRVKVGFAVVDGKKVRVDRKTGNPIGQD